MANIDGFIVLTGVDGSGKSAVIEEVQKRLQAEGRPVHLIARHQNTGEDAKAPIENHALPVRPALASGLKLAWNALKWWRTYHQKHASHLRTGGLLISDRFYFDELILDPLKYRFGAPAGWVQTVRSWLPTPALCILLDAPAEILYSRKQENSLETVARLRQVYLDWAQANGAQVIDAARPLEQVVEDTVRVIQTHTKGIQP